MEWNAQTYTNEHDFVFKYGESLLELIPQKPIKILDIGCGTGELTNQLAQLGHEVTGIDQSANMIEQAKHSFPAVKFLTKDILTVDSFEETYDVVFSNAAFHWILDQERLVENIGRLLRPNGVLICEFGAKGNIKSIEEAFKKEMIKLGIEPEQKFCFPSKEAFQQLLEKNHFKVEQLSEFDRPTPLNQGKAGLRIWLEQFYADELGKLTKEQRASVLENMNATLQPTLWKEDHWEADYRRLRVKAIR